MPMSSDRFTVARHRYTVGKSFGAVLLFVAFIYLLQSWVINLIPGNLLTCRLSVVCLLRRCRSAVKCSWLCEVLSTVAYLHGPPGFCTKSRLSVCQSSWAPWQELTTTSSRAEPTLFTHSPWGGCIQTVLCWSVFEQDAEPSPDSCVLYSVFVHMTWRISCFAMKGPPLSK